MNELYDLLHSFLICRMEVTEQILKELFED